MSSRLFFLVEKEYLLHSPAGQLIGGRCAGDSSPHDDDSRTDHFPGGVYPVRVMFLPLTLSLLLAPQNQEPASHSSKEEVVTEAAIQAVAAKVKEILPRVAELRGREFKKGVPSGVKTPDQFMEFAKANMDEEYGEGKFEAWTKAYRLFGFIGEEDDLESLFAELLRGQVGGWYDPAEGRFWMVSTYNKGGMADIIMAHELTHALDDQYYDLAAYFAQIGRKEDPAFAGKTPDTGDKA